MLIWAVYDSMVATGYENRLPEAEEFCGRQESQGHTLKIPKALKSAYQS